jgi:hypothetical protein
MKQYKRGDWRERPWEMTGGGPITFPRPRPVVLA